MNQTGTRRWLWTSGAIAAGALMAGVAAIAGAQPGPGSTIRACVNQSSDTIKIASAGEVCKNNETLLTWNTQGAPGPAGPAGPAGGGLTGPTFDGGGTATNSDSPKTMIESCGAGEIVFTGGAVINANGAIPAAVALQESRPVNFINGYFRGWQARAVETAPTSEAWSLQVQMICVDEP